jgi:hypothetical protein
MDHGPSDLIGCHSDIRSLFGHGLSPVARSMVLVSRSHSRLIH